MAAKQRKNTHLDLDELFHSLPLYSPAHVSTCSARGNAPSTPQQSSLTTMVPYALEYSLLITLASPPSLPPSIHPSPFTLLPLFRPSFLPPFFPLIQHSFLPCLPFSLFQPSFLPSSFPSPFPALLPFFNLPSPLPDFPFFLLSCLLYSS